MLASSRYQIVMFKRLSRSTKVGLGALLSYTSFEAYMQLQTWRIIEERAKALRDLLAAQTDQDFDKFKLATVSGMFVNPFVEYRPQTAFEFLLVRVMELVESFYGNQVELHEHIPGGSEEVEDLLKTFRPNYELYRRNSEILQQCVASGTFAALTARLELPPVRDQLLFTWLGQLCSLVQISGINFVTDPMFADHLFTKSIGPRRLVLSPMTVGDVKFATRGALDFVLVSHNHPDHLDFEAAKEIGNLATWIVPLGVKRSLAQKGIYNVVEMDWWDTLPLNKLVGKAGLPDEYDVVCVPAMHWSGRHVVDSNTTLWASFILRRNGNSILYHAGDTGYSQELFQTIGRKYGPVALSLLPIGQYCPSWHQRPRHISPEECLKIASLLRSTNVLGVHFGTFKLSSEPILEPKNKLLALARQHDKVDYYKVPEFGQTYVYHIQDGVHRPSITR